MRPQFVIRIKCIVKIAPASPTRNVPDRKHCYQAGAHQPKKASQKIQNHIRQGSSINDVRFQGGSEGTDPSKIGYLKVKIRHQRGRGSKIGKNRRTLFMDVPLSEKKAIDWKKKLLTELKGSPFFTIHLQVAIIFQTSKSSTVENCPRTKKKLDKNPSFNLALLKFSYRVISAYYCKKLDLASEGIQGCKLCHSDCEIEEPWFEAKPNRKASRLLHQAKQ